MNRQTLIPWLFFGPLMVAILANLIHLITKWPQAATTAAIATTLAATVLLTCICHWIFTLAKKKQPKDQPQEKNSQPTDSPKP